MEAGLLHPNPALILPCIFCVRRSKISADRKCPGALNRRVSSTAPLSVVMKFTAACAGMMRTYIQLPLRGTVSAAVLIATIATAGAAKLQYLELCNGGDQIPAESQIAGCSALLEPGLEKPHTTAMAYNNRAGAYFAKGDFQRAIQDYNESIRINPNSARTFNNRGVVFQKAGDIDRAIEDFDAALRLDPFYVKAMTDRAESFRIKGDYNRALQDLIEIVRIDPKKKGAWNELCWVRAIMGDLKQAMANCNRAIQLEPNVAAAYDSRGFTHLRLSQWEAAIADFNMALRLDSRLASSQYGRGIAKLRRGDRSGGTADLSAAIEAKPDIVEEFARYGLR